MKPKFSKTHCILGLILMLMATSCAPRWRYSWKTEKSPINLALIEILEDSNEKMAVAPIVVSVETTFSEQTFRSQGVDMTQWKRTVAKELLAMAESELHRTVGKYENFKVVDRYTIERVLSNLKLSMAISNDERLQVGKMLGATHLVMCELLRTPSSQRDVFMTGYKVTDTITARLVDVPTGEVLATQIMTKLQ